VNGQEVAFLILAVIGGLAGLLVVTSRNVVHAALYLVVALASVAGVYLLLAAPFVAFVQVIIYVGAIVVLLLFGIMLTRAPVGRRVLDNTLRARVGAFVVGAGLFTMLTVFLAARSARRASPPRPPPPPPPLANRCSGTTCCPSRRSACCCWPP